MGNAQILLIGDGELESVRAILSELDLEFENLAAAKLEPGTPLPSNTRLLVTTARTALELPARPFEHLGSCWIAVVEGDSKTQRARLRKLGFDYLIPTQAPMVVVRTLLLGCFYRGRERHAAARVAMGIAVGWRSGWRRGRALLVDLSIDGCRLMLDTRPERGQLLTLRIPVPGSSHLLLLKGQVVRTGPAGKEGGKEGQVAAGLRFRPLSNAAQAGLAALLRERASGPAALPQVPAPARTPTAPALPPTPAAPAGSAGSEKARRLTRAEYPQELDAMCSGATRALLGRDLSEQGMRVEPNARIELRQRIRLALHGCPSGEPILIEAHVARDDGAKGLMLRFDWMEPADLARLRNLLESLPELARRLEDDSALHAVEITPEADAIPKP